MRLWWLAKGARMKPRDLAEMLRERLEADAEVRDLSIAGPGFLNWRLAPAVWRDRIRDILTLGTAYGDSSLGAGQVVNVEYVSTNPTGPLTVGHARGAVVGDALAGLLEKAGYQVTREYYINDAGAQVDTLARSTYLRYREALGLGEAEIPEGFYPGEYLKEVGAALADRDGRRWLDLPETEWLAPVREFAVEALMAEVKADLARLGIHQEVFTSERSLVDAGAVEDVMSTLEERNLIYTGILEPPKGKKPKDWEPRPQTLFRATDFGDDVDRPLKKSDGSWTYFANDIAYHLDKYRRGFLRQIDIWGADHSGYVKRMRSAVTAVSDGEASLEVKICQLVKLTKGGQPLRMSKRAGTFVTLRDLIEEVGAGAVRFTMLTRKNDAPLDFDLDKAVEQSRDNPVFYVQYAHARAMSVLRHAGEDFPEVPTAPAALAAVALDDLTDSDEMALIQLLAQWPRMVESAAEAEEPHRVAFYLYDVAARFHGLWTRGKDETELRFLLSWSAGGHGGTLGVGAGHGNRAGLRSEGLRDRTLGGVALMADMIRAEDIRRIIADKDRREPGEGAIPEPLSPRQPLTKPPPMPPLLSPEEMMAPRGRHQPQSPARATTANPSAQGSAPAGSFLYSEPPSRPPVLPPMPLPGAPSEASPPKSPPAPEAPGRPEAPPSTQPRPTPPSRQPPARSPVMPPTAPPAPKREEDARPSPQQAKPQAPTSPDKAGDPRPQTRPPSRPPVMPQAPADTGASRNAGAQARPAARPPVMPPMASAAAARKPQALQSPPEAKAAEQPDRGRMPEPQSRPEPLTQAPAAPPPAPATPPEESWMPPALRRIQERLPPDEIEQWDAPPEPEAEPEAPEEGERFEEPKPEQPPLPLEPEPRDAPFDEWNDPPGASLTEQVPAWAEQPWPADDETQTEGYEAPPLFLPGEEGYEDAEVAPSRRRRWLLPIVIAVLALVGFAAVLLYGFGTENLAPTIDAPTLQAQSDVDKIRPSEPGGLQVPNRDVEVLNQEAPAAEPETVVLQPPPEEPAPLPPVPRVTISPPSETEPSAGAINPPISGVTITPPTVEQSEPDSETAVTSSETEPSDRAAVEEVPLAPATTDTTGSESRTPDTEGDQTASAATETPPRSDAGTQPAAGTQTAAVPPAEAEPEATADTQAESGGPSRLAAPGLAVPPRPSVKLGGDEASVAAALAALAPPVAPPPPEPAAADRSTTPDGGERQHARERACV